MSTEHQEVGFQQQQQQEQQQQQQLVDTKGMESEERDLTKMEDISSALSMNKGNNQDEQTDSLDSVVTQTRDHDRHHQGDEENQPKQNISLVSLSGNPKDVSPTATTTSTTTTTLIKPFTRTRSFSEVSRPSIYPAGTHIPVARNAFFDRASTTSSINASTGLNTSTMLLKRAPFDPLNHLKSHDMEGLYNLSMILLMFSLFYNFVRNVREKGWRVDFMILFCKPLWADMAFAFGLCVSIMAYSIAVYLLVKIFMVTHSVHRVGRNLIYVLVQVMLYSIVTTLLLVREATPLITGFMILHTIVYSLKMHSYYATNLLLMKETEIVRKKTLAEFLAAIPSDERDRDEHSYHGRLDDEGHKTDSRYASPMHSNVRRLGSGAANVDDNDDDNDDGETRSGLTTAMAATTTETKGEEQGQEQDHGASDSYEDEHGHETEKKSSFGEQREPKLELEHGGKEAEEEEEEEALFHFPNNVTFNNFAFFMYVAPVLVYETRYPRTSERRNSYMLNYLVQITICIIVEHIILSQLLLPVLMHSSGSFVFDVMKIAIPSILLWLIGFYGFFHCGLNAWAELIRFADRQFYSDWWNASSLDSFWNKWNILVHEWCLRHIFVESQAAYQVSKANAALATFLISAILHEYIFAVAFRSLRPAMFTGMLLQVPFIYFFRKNKNLGKRLGNILVWVNLILGHPLIEILYFRKYFESNREFFKCRNL
eukprot:CAMPEP_0184708286 /NCGR_PEP_ID=MMETSP0313-20130426/37698_1 /TAXON_ID=2792 /ORGANISM="Porphyridium aerugineum, Strain SAG 1380-2" /LENGTH=710 /DNA_ID=CAMNT_0027169871 /DNA_START=191 /DNA_END=2323 /DNA_ORIENTATION=+